MHGFQLWANLPSALKMTTPRYQDIQGSDIEEIIDDDGTRVKIIIGKFWGKTGPVDGIAADPLFLDISMPPNTRKTFPVETYARTFAYIFAGSGTFRDASNPVGVKVEKEFKGEELHIRDLSGNRTLVNFDTATRSSPTPAGGHAVPAGLRSADQGAGRLAWSHRDEHQPGADRSDPRSARGHVHQRAAGA